MPRSTSSTRRIGLDRLKALHINDSQMPLGSNRDRHASVGEGLIGERLSVFLGRPRLQGLPAVLETLGTTARAARPTTCASSSASGAWASAADVRVAVVDPQAYTPPYDDELCRALAAAGADVELLTAHFTHGEAPVAHGYVRRELFGPPLAGLIARRPRRPCAVPLKATGHALGLARLVRRARAWRARRRALAVGALPVARPARAARRRARAPARPCSRRTTCCRGARATPRRCGPSSTASCDRVIVHGAASRDRLLVEVGGVPPERIAVIPHALLHAGAGVDAARPSRRSRASSSSA